MPLAKLGIRERIPTKKAITLFLRHTQRLAITTQKGYKEVLYRFSAEMPDFIDLITAEHIDRYLLTRKISNNSRNTELTPIKSLFKYLETYHDVKNVAEKVKYLRYQPFNQRVFSEVEYRKILDAASEKERMMVRFLANTGIRVQEFCDLSPGSVSPDCKFITVIGKGNKRRIVPLNDTCRACLPILFDKKYNRDSISWIFKKLCRKAGIPKGGPHALRHRAITQLIKKGVPVAIVSKIAGHSSPEITMKIYCHLTIPDYLGATDVLDNY